MNRLLFYLFFLLCNAITACDAPQTLPYERSKISNELELHFAYTSKRGIETSNGVVYMVDDSLKILSAYKNGSIVWRADVMAKCGKPFVGKPEIASIRLSGETIELVFGKHDFAHVSANDGKIDCIGAD